jgi:hypothetical protein
MDGDKFEMLTVDQRVQEKSPEITKPETQHVTTDQRQSWALFNTWLLKKNSYIKTKEMY